MLKIAWYIAPYKRDLRVNGFPTRYCAMNDYTQQIIYTDCGKWVETEVLGNRCIVKVKAEESTLLTLNGVFKRIPKDLLDDSLSDLSASVKTGLRNEVLDMGYTLSEINNKLPNPLGTYTLRDVLKFMATKKYEVRYDADKDEIVCDGKECQCRSIESIDEAVT
jgi:hypothetical protein